MSVNLDSTIEDIDKAIEAMLAGQAIIVSI